VQGEAEGKKKVARKAIGPGECPGMKELAAGEKVRLEIWVQSI